MATNERFMPVPPEAVWDVLARPGSYGYWVIGSKVIRDADPAWPAPGTRFHHTVGAGPVKVSDHTESLEAQRPRRLKLKAKARPLGTAYVTLEMLPEDGGTRVKMTENPADAAAVLVVNPIVHLLTGARNAKSLMRLEELALRQVGSDHPRAQAPSST